jgi:hypothetical protein
MSFGLGFSMPHLPNVLASGAVVTPMTIQGTSPFVAQTISNITIDGGSLTFGPAIAGDVIIVAYSDDTGLAPSWGTPTGYSAPTQVAFVGSSLIGVWYIFQWKATSTSASAILTPTLGDIATGYSFSAGWLVRGANATTPFENKACAAFTLGAPGSFSVTTAAANDCVLGIAYATPVPTAVSFGQITSFAPITSGWTAQGPALDGLANTMFYTFVNTNVATSGTKTISVTSDTTSNTGAVLTLKLKK